MSETFDRLVSVAVPVAIDRAFTYRVPRDLDAVPSPGVRVLVPFGPRAVVGVVRPTPASTDADLEPDKIRPILGLLDDGEPALTPALLRLVEWMSDYYVAPVGEVYRLALPGLMTNADARTAILTDAGRDALQGGPLLSSTSSLDPSSVRLLSAIAAAMPAGLAVGKLPTLRPRIPAVLHRLAELEARGLCQTRWEDSEGDLRTETHVRRTDWLRGGGEDEAALQTILGRSKRRRALLDHLETLASDDDGWVPLSDLRGPFPRVRELLPPLVEANLVATEERPRRLDPFAHRTPEPAAPRTPTSEQDHALRILGEDLDARTFRSALLHGITGSGKTEVYLQVIARARKARRSAIVLVPEIALTPQLADRFRARFGDEVAVLHSGLTPRQRLDAWQQIRAGLRPIVIGARSAIFAPVSDLGVVVVDEEHDPSFKQEDGVRYNARDVALVRGKDADALVILGSATPALETWAAARAGRHRHLQLRTRPTPRPLPTVELIPLSVHRPDPESMLTAVMRQAVADTVAAGEQAILFLNRRGFATTLLCQSCGSFQQCPDCSAPSMTYHLARNRLMCHLCGHMEAAPRRCRTCGSEDLARGGVGTERVELALSRALEGVRVLRLDRDVARGRRLLTTLSRFRRGEADVLVGTQMLSKGHDFPGVTLVGILQGDHGLALPDPRAAERTFQLLTQVSGRAGRGDRPGRVLVQAWAVDHPAVVFASRHDYEGFATLELQARQRMGNPPAGHLVLFRVQGLDAAKVEARARAFADAVRKRIEVIDAEHRRQGDPPPEVVLLGPMPSPIAVINRRHRWQMLLRARHRPPLRWLLESVRPLLGPCDHGAHETTLHADVDPQSLL